VRRICPHCRDEGSQADPQKLGTYGISPKEAKTLRLYKGRGCNHCHRLGYRRRKGLFELIASTFAKLALTDTAEIPKPGGTME
jgi:type IV pilus assembly protein PilB